MEETPHIRDNAIAYLEELNTLSGESKYSFVWTFQLRAALDKRGFSYIDEIREKTGRKKPDDPSKDEYHKVKKPMSQRSFNRFTTSAKKELELSLIKDADMTEKDAKELVGQYDLKDLKDFNQLDLSVSKTAGLSSVKDWLETLGKKKAKKEPTTKTAANSATTPEG